MTLPFRAARLILTSRVLLIWSLIPFLITLTLYIFLLGWLQDWSKQVLLGVMASWGWDPQGWASAIVLFFSKIMVFIFAALTFSFTAALVATPFNDFLAEKTEARSLPPLPPAPFLSWAEQLKVFLIDLGKTLLAAFFSFLAFLFSWVPILNVIALLITFGLVAFQYLSYPQTRRRMGVGESMRFILRYPFASVGFGSVISVLFAVPLFSVLILPVAVVGGTLLFARASDSNSLLS